MTKTTFPASSDAKFQRVTGGRWAVVVPVNEAQAFIDARGVGNVWKSSEKVYVEAPITGEVYTTSKGAQSWTNRGTEYCALITVPRERQSSTGKGKGKGTQSTRQVAQVAQVTPEPTGVLAGLTPETLSALLALVQGQQGQQVTPEPAPTPAPTPAPAPAPIKSTTTVRSRKVSSARPRGGSRPMALID